MKKSKKNKKEETGITLIALVITIVVLLILSGIIIKGLTGNAGIIDTSIDIAKNSEIESYRAQLDEKVRSIIVSYSARDFECTLSNIAEELIKESWIISAVPNEDQEVSNPDIIVTVDKGYVYQVFYDSLYGKIKIEYIGKINPDKGNPDDIVSKLPTLVARYQRLDAKIYATAKHESGIAKIELIYKGTVMQTVENPSRRNNI